MGLHLLFHQIRTDSGCRSAGACLCTQGCPRDIHGLPYDGSGAREGLPFSVNSMSLTDGRRQWVDDVAAAGGSLYCFHQEATSKYIKFVNHSGK